MKVDGSVTLRGRAEDVWTTLHDPNALVRTIPGCRRLEEAGEDEYRMTVTAGVASITGTYLGTVRLTDPQRPHTFVLRASGTGNPGTVDATVTVSLTGLQDGTTRLDYNADAAVGGRIAGVGQRVLSGAAKRTAGEFFTNVDALLVGGAPVAPDESTDVPAAGTPAAEPSAAASVAGPPAGTSPAGPQAADRSTGAVFEAPSGPHRSAISAPELMKGAIVGAAIALAGVAAGGFLSRRSVRVLSPDVKVKARPARQP